MVDYIKAQLTSVSTWKGLIGLVAAVVMYFTPDNIDSLIIMALGALGVTDIFTLDKKD